MRLAHYSFKKLDSLTQEKKILVLHWRNNEAIRKWMYKKEIISLENHLSFINSLKTSDKAIYYLVERENIPIGVFSLTDINSRTAEWGYYLAPEFHSENLGVEFYYMTLSFTFRQLGFVKLIGFARVSNSAANSLNSLFGFSKKLITKSEDNEDYYFRELTKIRWETEIVNNKRIVRLLKIKQI